MNPSLSRVEVLYISSGLLFLTILGVYLALRGYTVGTLLVLISAVWAISIYFFMVKVWRDEEE
ncbi:MAG: hypothetical protein RXS23_09205 [Metallosphaera yellowstonensis]|jgi:hypothetical protein|uniref:Uncharacterized protein n=2 Tax=Metallosphaera TaxID=41980 RepID=H2C0Q1_9CREN|nr:hypothetical protein MetMK1DRAFT_00001220 [Metallosphaera yellowstonensis MK1]